MKRRLKNQHILDHGKTPVVTCQRCKNTYIVIWLTTGDDFNDFGDRHCPFCGLITEEFYLPAET